MSRSDLDVVFRQIDLDESERLWAWLPLTERIMADVEAAFRALPESVFLRTGDAVHLATAKAYSFSELWSGDVRLVAAAAHLGIAGRSVAAGAVPPARG